MMPSAIRKLTDLEQRQATKEFYERWKDRGKEKQDDQSFWNDLLHDVLGVERPSDFIDYQKEVRFEDSVKFADGYIRNTRVLIEQKSNNIDLSKGERQSGEDVPLRPDQQARRYANNMPVDERPKYIITSNFKEIWVYDENRPHSDPEKILLKDLPKEYYRLQFIVDTGNEHIKKEMELSIKAGEIVGEIYNALREQYHNPDSPETLKSLNVLCVRLVFCLYAEDAGLFGKKSAFHDYLSQYSSGDFRSAIKDLFSVLSTDPKNRDQYLKPDLAAFPYVNGGLFNGTDIEIPSFTDDIRNLILTKASANFNWSEISPTIFGAVFESTLNPETRRKGGMHYTSIENIHKVIDPLFYDNLCKEFESIKKLKQPKVRNQKIEAFRDKMANMTFLDPACGSGNFLTETYLSLRRLENEALEVLQSGQTTLGFLNPIKVHINQFYGIEINDFAVTVAKTALWIAESQMMQKTEEIMHQNLDFLPLRTYANIIENNALRIDWDSIVPKDQLNYIMGNPPFVGGMMMTRKQKTEMLDIFGDKLKGVGELDYVAAWYRKATNIMAGTDIEAAFVSTNSITQGEQTTILWKKLIEEGIIINFAHRTFRWDSEANLKAHVHCVIIGFSFKERGKKELFSEAEKKKYANHINAYLVDAPDVLIDNRSVPLDKDAPAMNFGNMPRDGGGFILTEEEAANLQKNEPLTKKWIHPFLGAAEFINNKKRFCLWLEHADPSELRQCPTVMARISSVKKMRLESKAEATRKLAETPTTFAQITQPVGTPFLMVPSVSSEKRKYVPMGFLDGNVISSNAVQIIPNAQIYHFGILTSNVHMAWMRTVCGRLEMRYRYSKDIVYNNFPWPTPTKAQKEKIEQTAQAILDIRAKYPEASLADLYDDATMPADLRKAHQNNDKAVMEAYGFWGKLNSETECVAELIKQFQTLSNTAFLK